MTPLEYRNSIGRATDLLRTRPTLRSRCCDQALDGLTAALDRAEQATKKHSRTVQSSSRETRRVSADFECAERIVVDAQEAERRARAEVAQDLDRIKNMSAVRSVQVTEKKIVVTTNNLEIKEDGVRYDVGCYRITIPKRAADENRVKITALHQRRDRKHDAFHPHFYSHGNCFGNMGPLIITALKDCEFDVAVQLIITVLQSGTPRHYNGSHYRYILRAIGRPKRNGKKNQTEED